MSREEKRLNKIQDDKSRQEWKQEESRRDKKRQETRRNETRKDTRNQETRRDETRHFRNRIFRPSERRRITLQKQYSLDPRLSWTLKNNTFRRPKCFRGWKWSQLPCSGGFQTRYHYQPLLEIEATKNVILQGLWDPRFTAILRHWLTNHYYGGLKSSTPW